MKRIVLEKIICEHVIYVTGCVIRMDIKPEPLSNSIFILKSPNLHHKP